MKAFLMAHITKFLIAGLIGGVGATSFIVADRLDKPVVEGVKDEVVQTSIRETQETGQVEVESGPEELEEKIVEVIEPVPQVDEVEPPANSQVATAEPSVVLTSPEELQTQVEQNTQTIIEHEQEINNQQQQIDDHEQRITIIENQPPPTCQDATATNYGGLAPCTYPQPEPVCEDQTATNYKGALPCVYPEPPTPAKISGISYNDELKRIVFKGDKHLDINGILFYKGTWDGVSRDSGGNRVMTYDKTPLPITISDEILTWDKATIFNIEPPLSYFAWSDFEGGTLMLPMIISYCDIDNACNSIKANYIEYRKVLEIIY